jgi:hypothetical protein
MQIVPEAKAQDNVAVLEPALTGVTAAFRRALRARTHGSGPLSRPEGEALSLANEAIRRVLEEELQRRADQEAAEISIDGKPALAQAIGRGYAERTSRALHEDLVSAGRAPPSRSTIERIAVELGQHVKAAVHRIEPALRRYESVPRGARGVTASIARRCGWLSVTEMAISRCARH